MAKIETTFIRPKELFTPDTGETKVVYDGYQNNPHELITEDGFAGALDTAMPTALAKAQVIETTWQELKDKRDNGQLIAGSLYRITDYNCTTTQENTRSAGHQFDIVLLALSEDKLAEEGWAMMHENDTYFVNSNLSAWKVWYCLDNDKSRFAWADPVNGKGVIYRLIDEWNNDVGYDFKNIQFLVKIDMETGYYDGGGDDTYVYSLNAWIDGNIMDASIIGNTLQNDVGIIDMVANNVIKTMPPVYTDAKGYYLPFNVILTSNEDGDGYYGANDINFDNNSNHNIVTSPCSAIHFNGSCSGNVIFSNVYAIFINCVNMTEQNVYSGLYLNNKSVLTEK